MSVDVSTEQSSRIASTVERIQELKEMGDSSWANMLGREVIDQVARMQEQGKVEDAQNRLKPLIPLIAEVKTDPNLSKKFIEGIESASEIQTLVETAPSK